MRIGLAKFMAMLLMVLGVAMLVRGLEYSVSQGLGWQGTIQAVIAGALVFVLGFVRWRQVNHR